MNSEPHPPRHLRSLSDAPPAPRTEFPELQDPAHLLQAWVAPGDESNGAAPEEGPEEAISHTISQLLRMHAGRAPTTARTILASDLAVVTLRGCLTTAERTLANGGESAMVMEIRAALHDTIRAPATAAVEEITGQPVVAYLTDQQHEPDLAIIAFVLWLPSPHGTWADPWGQHHA